MAKRTYEWKYTARIRRETLPRLQALANSLGLLIDAPGSYEGKPSVPNMLDDLGDAYERDPVATIEALKSIGVGNQEEAS